MDSINDPWSKGDKELSANEEAERDVVEPEHASVLVSLPWVWERLEPGGGELDSGTETPDPILVMGCGLFGASLSIHDILKSMKLVPIVSMSLSDSENN